MALETITVNLSALELDILERILNNEIEGTKEHEMDYPTVAVIVYIGDRGEIQFGRCRWGHRNNYHMNGNCYDTWDISPFPGAWEMVPSFRIVRVSHIEAF